MKNFAFSFILLSILFLTSCIKESDWEKITIPAEQELIFSEPNKFDGAKSIILPIDKTDTIVVINQGQINRICYFKLAYPDNNIIIIECIKGNKDGKVVFETRFVDLQKE